MCGRYALATPSAELVEVFDVPPLGFAWPERYNIGPGQSAPVVAADRQGRRMGLMHWGFVPTAVRDPGKAHINARAESVARTGAFRVAFARRRLVVPADGFYEWRKDLDGRTPVFFRGARGGILGLAGIWEAGRGPDGKVRAGFAVLTVAASADVAPVHDRMPALLDAEGWATWLDPASRPDALLSLLVPAPDGTLQSHRVSRRVNSVANDDAGLLVPVPDGPPATPGGF